MRLIDADEIKYGRLNFYSTDGDIPYYKDYVEKLDIDSMPTVDAIPVEWIEEQTKQFKEAEEWAFNEYGETDYWSVALEMLIERWKGKDNGN